MLKELQYPFDSQLILKKRRSLKKKLLSENKSFIDKNIAILGGSTTHDIAEILELFLLDFGIRPSLYESEFGQWWQDSMFPPKSDPAILLSLILCRKRVQYHVEPDTRPQSECESRSKENGADLAFLR